MRIHSLALSLFLACALSSIAQMTAPKDLFGNYLTLSKQKKYDEALVALRKAANDGHALAQNELGALYYSGTGVQQSYPLAKEWYFKAAQQGEAEACYNLGFMYSGGYGVEQNSILALEWYNKAAELGSLSAINNIGFMFENGKGTSPNYTEAMKYYRKAAEKGNARAQSNLAIMYSSGYDSIPIEMDQAKYWYQKSAAQGDESAKVSLRDIESITTAGNNAEPLGFKIGVTHFTIIKRKDADIKYFDRSSWTNGVMYKSDGKVHNVEGLKNITYIFNSVRVLDAIIINMDKNYFDKINNYLKSKYILVTQTNPPVGDKFVKYKQGNSIIEIHAPHMDFEMEIVYKTTAFDFVRKQKLQEEINKKEQEQKGKF